jgi:broad specificity phosphatase PhoE
MGSLFLVRHATTRASAAGTNLGQADDAALTSAGTRLAGRVGAAIALELNELPHNEIQIVSSPAQRCRATAEAIARAVRLGGDAMPITIEDALRELDYGSWEGLSAEECHQRDPELRAAWEADPHGVHAPDGESGADVAARAFSVLERLDAWLAAEPTRAAIVVTHNHVIRLRLAALLGIPLPDYRRRFLVDPGSYSLVTLATAGRVPAVRRIGVVVPANGGI